MNAQNPDMDTAELVDNLMIVAVLLQVVSMPYCLEVEIEDKSCS